MRSLLLFVFLCFTLGAFSQQRDDSYVAFDYHYGSILKHNKSVAHLIHAHPAGIMLSYNVRTHGEERWEQEYNYPDWGVSFLYEDFNYALLGKNYSVGFHYNFYFLNRNLQVRIGEGLNYNTNPFDLETNFKNTVYGSHITGFSQIGVQYTKPRIIDNFGIRAGILLLHHSNGGVKSPNTGTNVFSTSIGVTYDFSEEKIPNKEKVAYQRFTEPIKYNFVLRGGVNESDRIGLGQHPFFVLSAFADKRLSFKSTIQFGVDLTVSQFLKKQREASAASRPFSNINLDIDYKRVSVFLGHEFRFNKVAVPTQIGFYVYNPTNFDGLTYIRAGVKYYINEKWFAVGTVKTHGFNAESIEWGIGLRI
ncbi:MAG: hypothetical protein ACI97R_001142 [Candidatus Azotimanducaceae bacterium]|jgi:hypothetical protein